MAFTVTKTPTVFGNKAVVILNITADGAEAAIETGLSRIEGRVEGYTSMTAITYTIYDNKGTTSTAIGGMLGVSGLTSGDQFCVVVFGTR